LQKCHLCETTTITKHHEQKAKNNCKQEEKQKHLPVVGTIWHSVQQKMEK